MIECATLGYIGRRKKSAGHGVQNISTTTKWIIYAALNIAVWVVLIVGAAIGGGSIAELPYVAVLFALCASPLPFVGRLNGTFAMLGVAFLAFFIEFGLLDAVHMFSPQPASATGAIFSAGEVMILVSAILKILGFHLGARISNSRRGVDTARDWSSNLLAPLGLLLWASGIAALLYQGLFLQLDNSDVAVRAAYTSLGSWGTAGMLLISTYAGPLGIIILAYWWTRSGRRSVDLLMLSVIAVQFAVGWVIDTKEVALSAPIVMLLTRFIIQGKVPTRWLVCSLLGVVLVFPVLTAKRIIMTEALHLNRAQALSRTFEIISRAITEQDLVRSGKYAQKSQTALERSTDKAAVELFALHVGNDKPYKLGSTLEPLLYVFIPRVIWSDKPGDNSAQTFNRDFHLSEDPDTHISPTHIGELYWNFGYPGLIVGMLASGILLGYVCSRFDPSTQTSMTRTLVIIVTLYQMVGGNGGQIEITYVVWLRVMVLIGMLHWVFARDVAPGVQGFPAPNKVPVDSGHPERSLQFPNLLR